MQKSSRSGRPREFDEKKALERAMRVFWTKGYEGASIADLTRAMGINRPSLYAAFGDKQSLFQSVLDLYAEGPAAYVQEALQQPSARQVAERLLQGAADSQTNPKHPGGCLIADGALAGSELAGVLAKRTAVEDALRGRLDRAKHEGDLPSSADPAALARSLAATVYGMAVLASGGATRADLEGVIEQAMRAWPSGKSR